MTIAIIVAAAAILCLIGWRAWLARTNRNYFVPFIPAWRRSRFANRIGCAEGRSCRGEAKHGHCVHCKTWTCGRGGYIQPSTLRRRVGPTCLKCAIRTPVEQQQLQTTRRRKDWDRLTDPIDASHLELGTFPEQYPGPTRATLRAFIDSDAEFATVKGIGAEQLNQSIAVLGLSDEVYAEQRGHQVVIRHTQNA